MSPENNDLDRVLSEIRNETVDDSAVEAAAERVRARLHAPLNSCADFQALMPDYRAGRLSEARALLLKDHTHECVACRKAMEGAKVVAFQAPRPVTAAPWFRWAMAAGMAVGAVLAGWGLFQAVFTDGGRMVVEAASGPVYSVSGQTSRPLGAGAQLDGSEIRTGQGAGAVVRLGDGSRVEMRERTAFSVSSSGRDMTVRLARGGIIVQAAKRRTGHLYVAARDCRVAVTGTVFSVNSGVKGSRVSVIEGEVRVAQGGQEKVLRPGEQYATAASIAPVPVAEEIAWSRNAAGHVALLNEFSVLQKRLEQVRMPDLRYGSRLLAMLPADTMVYAAIPNLGGAIGEAERIFQQRAAESPVLKQWWDEKMAGNGEAMLEKLQTISGYLGDEIVVAATLRPGGGGLDSPIFLAEPKKTGLRDYLQGEFDRLGAGKALRIADSMESVGSARRGDAVAYLGADVVAVSDAAGVQRMLAGGGGFAATPFGARVTEAYRDGAGFVFAADLEKFVPQGKAERSNARVAGFDQLKYAVLEQKTSGGRTDTQAVLAFRGPRRGLASLLSKPAAIGALDYISPEAGFAAGFTVVSPAALFDELLATGEGKDGLAKAEAELGISLRDDVLASLGSEVAFALDGPVVPVPSWKVVAEVRDANRLQFAIGKLVDAANRHAAEHGKTPAQLSSEVVSGRTWYRLAAPKLGSTGEADYTYDGGYLVAAPSRALVEQALQYRANGYGLTHSAAFAALLPRDRYADFSGMVYHNMGSALTSMMGVLNSAKGLDPSQKNTLDGMAKELAKPMLVTVYGEEDRITLASAGSLLGLTPANLMRVTSPLGMLGGMSGRRQRPAATR